MATIAPTQENFVERISALPLVKDAYTSAYGLVQSNTYASAAYSKVEQISTSLLNYSQPLQNRLPIATANSYANSALDYVEKQLPMVKTVNGEEVVKNIRGPADQAASIAKAYTDVIQSRLSPVTEQLQLRLQQGSETIHSLQERLSSVAASLPRDKASASEAVTSLFRELDSLSSYIAEQRKNLPANVQATVQPVLDRLQESFTHIKSEASNPDLALSVKTTNILSYSKDQLSPLLNDAVGVVKTVIAAASQKTTEAKDATVEKAAAVEEKVSEKTTEAVQEVKEVSKKSKKNKANGTA